MKNIFIILLLICVYKINVAQKDSIQRKLNYKQYFHPNNKLASEGYLKNNVPIGYWKSYYITGIKKSEGKWKNNSLDSIWIFYDQLGDTIEKINYYQGLKNGYHYKFYRNNKYKNRLYSKELYVNGKRNNMAVYYYENGQTYKLIPFKDDKKHGLGFEYDKNNTLRCIIRFKNNEIVNQENINRYNENGKKEGIWRSYYSNGTIQEEKSYINGELNDYYKIYNEQGQILQAVKYKNGNIDLEINDNEYNIEIKEEYDKNENLILQGSYQSNIPIGTHRSFNQKGKVTSSQQYNITGKKIAEGIVLMNGNEDGEWIHYYHNGDKQAVGRYRNGIKVGKWIYYYHKGGIKQTGTYSNGKYSGEWKWYYDTGELLKEEFYVYGKLDGEVIEYSELGGVIAKGNYVEGFKEGKWIYKIGDQELKGQYVMDFKDGIWKSYYLNEENLSFKGNYIQGNEDGKHSFYYPNGKIKEEQYYNEGEKVRSWSKYNERGDLILVIQFKNGKEFKINGVKVKLELNEN